MPACVRCVSSGAFQNHFFFSLSLLPNKPFFKVRGNMYRTSGRSDRPGTSEPRVNAGLSPEIFLLISPSMHFLCCSPISCLLKLCLVGLGVPCPSLPCASVLILPTVGTASEYVGSHQRLLQTSEHSQQRVKTGQELPEEGRLLMAPCR